MVCSSPSPPQLLHPRSLIYSTAELLWAMNGTVLNDQNMNVNVLIFFTPFTDLRRSCTREWSDYSETPIRPQKTWNQRQLRLLILALFVFNGPWINDFIGMFLCSLLQITEKLSDHEGKLQEAQDLLHSAQGRTRQAGALAEQNQANLTTLEVCTHTIRTSGVNK